MQRLGISSAAIFALVLSVSVFAQSQSPTPTPMPEVDLELKRLTDAKALIDKRTQLLDSQNKYWAAVRAVSEGRNVTTEDSSQGSVTNAGNDPKRPGNTGETKFEDIGAKTPPREVVSLSYEAVKEISSKLAEALKPTTPNFDRIVFYHQDDFDAISRYRLYRENVHQAVLNYQDFRRANQPETELRAQEAARRKQITDLLNSYRDEIERGNKSTSNETAAKLAELIDRPVPNGIGWLGAIPTAGSAVVAVADLLNLFRTEQTIYQTTTNTVSQASLNAEFADKLLAIKPDLLIYNPERFVPEYEVGDDRDRMRDRLEQCTNVRDRLFYEEVACLFAASAYIDAVVAAAGTLPQSEQNKDKALIEWAKVIQRQINDLKFDAKPQPLTEAPVGTKTLSEFRNMVRADRLYRFLDQGDRTRTGVALIKLLSSGGSYRVRKNLLLGTRTDYSGSAVIEVIIYGTDGLIRSSKVLSHSTGFRRSPAEKKSEH